MTLNRRKHLEKVYLSSNLEIPFQGIRSRKSHTICYAR